MREQINNYKNALQLISDNSVLYNEINKIKNRYMQYASRNAIVITVGLVFLVAYFILMLSTMPLGVFRGVLGAIRWYLLLILGILTCVLIIYKLYWKPLNLPEGYVSELNKLLKENYKCLNDNIYSMMFDGGKCYVVDRMLGVKFEMDGKYEEGKCRLEHREWYEISGDYRIWRETDFCIVSIDKQCST